MGKITYHSGANGDDKSRNGYGHLFFQGKVTQQVMKNNFVRL